LYRLCQFDSSLDFFNESLTKNPNDVDILINKGSALGKLGYFSEAIVYYDHALRLNPDSLSAKNNKANALANLGDFKDAILLYDEVLEQNPNYLTARANLEIVLSSNIDVSGNNSEFGTENISNQKSLESEKIFLENSEKQNSSNFFDEIGNLFSTLSSLFGLQN
jgi:Putative Zn-dependent protease, contains TPR repeats